MIDANPQDINMVDFTRPDGTKVMRSIGDYRQLNDGLFHAGTGSGSAYEYTDTANRLKFYVINMKTDPAGELSYNRGRTVAGRIGPADPRRGTQPRQLGR
ncbi:hypothetical protein E4K10_40685 [Streptomyces sp. T1317-0309]|nr:hypothetical protein E4K10_40685 [Streptomyces sp. T1317-0309]